MEIFSTLLAICARHSPVPGEFHTQRGQWRRVLMFSLICVWINDWVNNRKAGDLRRYRAHYDVIVMRDSKMANEVARYTEYVDLIILRWLPGYTLVTHWSKGQMGSLDTFLPPLFENPHKFSTGWNLLESIKVLNKCSLRCVKNVWVRLLVQV